MRVLDNFDIYARRGDTHGVWVDLIEEDDEEKITVVPFEEGDTVRFSIKTSPTDVIPLVQLVVETFEEGRAHFELKPEHTKGLAFDTYYYDIELEREDGYTRTLIPPDDEQPPAQFVITEEIT